MSPITSRLCKSAYPSRFAANRDLARSQLANPLALLKVADAPAPV